MSRFTRFRGSAGRLGTLAVVLAVTAALAPASAVTLAGDPAGARQALSPVRPAPAKAYNDLPVLHTKTRCVVQTRSNRFRVCRFGTGRKTVALVGDSKAAQWFTPMQRVAKRNGWRLVVIVKNGCTFGDVVRVSGGERTRTCESWARKALRAVKRIRPDVVVPVTRWSTALPRGAALDAPHTQEAMVRGLVSYWRQVLATGARVTPILDTPGPPGGDAPACVRKNRERLSRCAYPKAPAVRSSGAPAVRAAAARVKRVRPVSMTGQVCPNGRTCPAVIGGILVYRGGSHLSDTFATSRTDALGRALRRATNGELGRR